jgi:outer membrane immunogenic protein
VFGVEADYNWASIKNSSYETDGGLGLALDTLTLESKLRAVGTLRAKTGVVVDNLLIYFTGGFAYGDFRRNQVVTNFVGLVNTPDAFSYSDSKWGWVAGFGTEWAFHPNWSLKSEVLFHRFETNDHSFFCASLATCGPPGQTVRFSNEDQLWTTKLGLNYRWAPR